MERKIVFLREKVIESKVVYLVDNVTFDFIELPIVSVYDCDSDLVCRVIVPDGKYLKLFRDKEINLFSYKDHLKCVGISAIYLNPIDLAIGYNRDSGNRLRKNMINRKLEQTYLEVEKLILQKNTVI